MSPETIDRFVRTFLEAWARPDAGGFAALWLEDGLFVHPTVGAPLRGGDVLRWSDAIKAALPDLRFSAEAWAA